MSKLRKKLAAQLNVEMVTVDAPFPHPLDTSVRQWWERSGDDYIGLESSIEVVKSAWTNDCVGLFGFSQGARLVHLLASGQFLPGLEFVIVASGYDAPVPVSLRSAVDDSTVIRVTNAVPSLHVWGSTDAIITPAQSEALLQYYLEPKSYVHPGGHHVPMNAESCRTYLEFVQQHLAGRVSAEKNAGPSSVSRPPSNPAPCSPDPESSILQQEEVQALQAMYPDEFTLLSAYDAANDTYEHPIRYQVLILSDNENSWPPHPIRLSVTCPPQYPMSASPVVRIVHDNNGVEFPSTAAQECEAALTTALEEAKGMPSILNAVHAVSEYISLGPRAVVIPVPAERTLADGEHSSEIVDDGSAPEKELLAEVDSERKELCNQQGLEIAATVLATSKASATGGGSWQDVYTIGLVGKPSAGKSTLFNTATAFSRQPSGDAGAAMAPHPFTTIDPHRGVCLVPASNCPSNDHERSQTHGRDRHGQRLIPVILKDVAGLVPGAYQGRGRGNQFLHDLTDANVMLHVVDASGMADAEGRICGEESLRHPLDDMRWIRQELMEWVFTNLLHKWETIQRKGRDKLAGMFSGYGQNQATTERVLHGVETYMEEHTDRTMRDMTTWDAGDVYRLVSAFLGVRFPLALALNKMDLPSSEKFIEDIQKALPVHGSLIGTPLSARREMEYIRRHVPAAASKKSTDSGKLVDAIPPDGTLECLRAAISLCEPLLVFPVSDFETYAPLVGMNKHSIGDASLPTPGMIAALVDSGGCAPTMWDGTGYRSSNMSTPSLRDVLLMKPGSTVEQVFHRLKHIGALSGEFIRAEATSDVNVPPKPIPKHQIVTNQTRIIKIMTNKKTTS